MKIYADTAQVVLALAVVFQRKSTDLLQCVTVLGKNITEMSLDKTTSSSPCLAFLYQLPRLRSPRAKPRLYARHARHRRVAAPR